ncbi:MAG: acetoin utilization protein AcuC [Clostridia bacterium]|nr:acetoin utilization protein AcuC [Clostridia bacterium]
MPGVGKYIYSQQLSQYKFAEGHPFDPLRLEITTDLLRHMHVLFSDEIVAPLPASFETLTLVHDPGYIELVQNASLKNLTIGKNLSCGLGTDDNPIFCNMHEAASLTVGATVKAAELVLKKQTDHSLNISGGLHHAKQNQASGFCIYNDIAVAIAWIRKKYRIRVMYIDTDAHHGDGVQWFFYSDPNVLTVSIHEAGRYLFPGTGNIDEMGVGMGRGYCLNLPLEPYTNDCSYMECLEKLLITAAKNFRPDIIVSQHGCDIHYLDPLTHISVTNKTLSYIPQLIHTLAHEYAQGKWVALGGGGYDIWNVVPRAWSLVWGEVSNRTIPRELPRTWLEKWGRISPVTLLRTLCDTFCSHEDHPHIEEIREKNIVNLNRLMGCLQGGGHHIKGLQLQK